MPGMGLHSFKQGETVKLKVNSLTSMKTLLPVGYYRLPFCLPADGQVRVDHENLGEFLSGDRIVNSPYVLKMKESAFCEKLCSVSFGNPNETGNRKKQLSEDEKNSLKVRKFIKNDYHINWLVDNLPAIAYIRNDSGMQILGSHGFPIGYFNEFNIPYIYNHVNIVVDYHEVEGMQDFFRVVKFSVYLYSINDQTSSVESCKEANPTEHISYKTAQSAGPQRLKGDVQFTYDVKWKESDVSFGHRWDVYLHQTSHDSTGVHWKAIWNSLSTVLVLFFLIACVLVKNLKKDFARYESVMSEEDLEDAKEESGWKLVHADVFRPPEGTLFLSVIVGTGVQILLMSLLTVICALIGFASPNHRGHLVMALLFNYELMGIAAGFVAARLYKTFKGKSYQKCTMATALGFPCVFFSIFFIIDITAAFYGSTDAIPFSQIVLLLFLWSCVSTPLVFLGSFFGYKMDAIEFPVNTSPTPRKVQDQPWFLSMPFTILVAGLIPFSACFVEMYFIFLSVWANFYYHFFFILLFVWFILVVACVEISILHTYIQLCNENHHWWWSSFLIGGSTSIWFFLYSIYYFQKLHINLFATYILYFGYTFLASISVFLFTGAAGFFGSFWFNNKIYGSIKVD